MRRIEVDTEVIFSAVNDAINIFVREVLIPRKLVNEEAYFNDEELIGLQHQIAQRCADSWKVCWKNEGPEGAGTGGGLRYITEVATLSMVAQEQPCSCQAACARQLLKEAGVDVSEAELLEKIGYLEGWGTTSGETARALDELHPRLGFAGGAVDPETVAILFKRTPWIASLKTDRGTIHAVIVDRLEDDVVHVRDPWGISGLGSGPGSQATIKLSDFLDHWQGALNNAVFPNRLK
jgi:predicted double-glycine peptidase